MKISGGNIRQPWRQQQRQNCQRSSSGAQCIAFSVRCNTMPGSRKPDEGLFLKIHGIQKTCQQLTVKAAVTKNTTINSTRSPFYLSFVVVERVRLRVGLASL